MILMSDNDLQVTKILRKEWTSTATKITALYFDHILLDEAQLILDNEKDIRGDWCGSYVAEFLVEYIHEELSEDLNINPLLNNSVAYLLEVLESVHIDFQQIAEFYE